MCKRFELFLQYLYHLSPQTIDCFTQCTADADTLIRLACTVELCFFGTNFLSSQTISKEKDRIASDPRRMLWRS